MNDQMILKRISQGSQRALETAIKAYSSYVAAIVHYRSRGLLSPEDEDEIVSDVFFALWKNASALRNHNMKAWLGSVARNKTSDHLRKRQFTVPLEEYQFVVDDSAWEALSQKEKQLHVRNALNALSEEDREIFFRFYDLCQTTTQIAAEMDLTPSTVRTRLSRGREKLRTILSREGFVYE